MAAPPEGRTPACTESKHGTTDSSADGSRAQGGSRMEEPNGSKKSLCFEGILMEDNFVDKKASNFNKVQQTSTSAPQLLQQQSLRINKNP
jgi:hypothetical protein